MLINKKGNIEYKSQTSMFSIIFCALLFFFNVLLIKVVQSVVNLQLSQLSQLTSNKQVFYCKREILFVLQSRFVIQ